MMNGIQKVFAHLTHVLRDESPSYEMESDAGASYEADLSRSWHHDHWQSLLSCPMDARRYILEDWNDIYEPRIDQEDDTRIDSFSGRRVRTFN
jgi:hypothetical protein